MTQTNEQALAIQQITGLKPVHFADLIRTSQLIFDPSGGVSGKYMKVNWQSFGIPPNVEQNLRSLGDKYRYASPHIPSEIIWQQLTGETRSWFITHKETLWQFEEFFPALDED